MTAWLIDKSALVRLDVADDAAVWLDRIQRGLVAISTVTRLEVGLAAVNARQHALLRQFPPIAAMPVEYLTPGTEDRAVAVQAMHAAYCQHRAPSIPDLLIAATAELSGLRFCTATRASNASPR